MISQNDSIQSVGDMPQDKGSHDTLFCDGVFGIGDSPLQVQNLSIILDGPLNLGQKMLIGTH